MSYLVLVRHGESRWNLANKFTGWVDVPLSRKGVEQARRCARTLEQMRIDIAFTSTLERARATLAIILASQGATGIYEHSIGRQKAWAHHRRAANEEIPVHTSSKINERYYGDLQGINKDAARKRWGEHTVHLWRRSYAVPPPGGESLKDVVKRAVPYMREKIIPLLKKGKNVLVVAHGNSLRAIIKHLEQIPDDEIPLLELPLGVPIIYEYSHRRLKKVQSKTRVKPSP